MANRELFVVRVRESQRMEKPHDEVFLNTNTEKAKLLFLSQREKTIFSARGKETYDG